MKIINKKIKELIPYINNPRRNDHAVNAVASSIAEFGFKVPVVIDKDNIVITGHTRIKAAEKLGLKEIPCIIADDLTPEQVKAFRLADNKVSELADWDYKLLDAELKQITDDIDLESFGFSLDEIDFGSGEFSGSNENYEEYDSEEELNVRSFQSNAFENMEIMRFEGVGKYDIPAMQKCSVVGNQFIRFCDWKEAEQPENYIAHFYYDDYKFMNAWRQPDKFVDRLRQFKAVISPDFSLYTDFPRTLQILSCYRRQWCGAYWQSLGVNVIPDVVWGEESSFEFCFDGIPKGGTVAVSAVGVSKDSEWNGEKDNLFKKGYDEMMRRIEPETVLYYGTIIDGLEGNIIHIPSFYDLKRDYLNEKLEMKNNGTRKQ